VSAAPFDLGAARARFTALQRELVFFDGPGGTQVPDSVIDAVAGYLRESNANVSGPYETSRRTEVLFENARSTAARFLGCSIDEIVFGPNMTTLNFALSRTAVREFEPGDEILVTRLDHDANVSPWLELAHDKDLVVRFVDIRDDCSLDMDDLERQLSKRTRVVAFPLASNAVGTVTDAPRIVALAHEATHHAARVPAATGAARSVARPDRSATGATPLPPTQRAASSPDARITQISSTSYRWPR